MSARIGGVERDDDRLAIRRILPRIENVGAGGRQTERPGEGAVGRDPIGHDIEGQGKLARAGHVRQARDPIEGPLPAQSRMKPLHVAREKDAAAMTRLEGRSHENGVEAQPGGVIEYFVPGIDSPDQQRVHVIDPRRRVIRAFDPDHL